MRATPSFDQEYRVSAEAGTAERKPAAAAETPSVDRFERIVDEFQRRLYGFALRMTGNREDAEEIVQDAFVRAFRALGKMSPEQRSELRLQPWLYTITLNVTRNRLTVQAPDERRARFARRSRCVAQQHARGSRATRASRRARYGPGARRTSAAATTDAFARGGDATVHRRPQSPRDCGDPWINRSGP